MITTKATTTNIKIKEYMTVMEDVCTFEGTIKEWKFDKKCNEAIKDGWQPYGNPYMRSNGDMYQAFVK